MMDDKYKSVVDLVSFFEEKLPKSTKCVASSDGPTSVSKGPFIGQQSADLSNSTSNVTPSTLVTENEYSKISSEKNANPEKSIYPENHAHSFDPQSDINQSCNKTMARYEDTSKNTNDIASLKPTLDGPTFALKSSNVDQKSAHLSQSTSSIVTSKTFFGENDSCIKSFQKGATPDQNSSPENHHSHGQKSGSPNIGQQSAPLSKSTPSITTSPNLFRENERCKESLKKKENPEKLSCPEDHPPSLNSQSNAYHSNNRKYRDKFKNDDKNSIKVSNPFTRTQSLTQLPTISEANSPQMNIRSNSHDNIINEPSEKALYNFCGEGNVHGAEPISGFFVSESSLLRSESSNTLNVKDCSNMTINMPGCGGIFSSEEQQQSTNNYTTEILNRSISTNSEIEIITDRTRGMIHSHRIYREFKNISNRFLAAKEILEKKGLLVITCNPGDGSTYLGLELLVSYKGYLKGYVNDASELRDFLYLKDKSIAMIDNACGGTPLLFSHSEVGELCKIIEIHRGDFVEGDKKLIIIIKNSIKENCKELLEDLKKKILNFSNQSFQLNVNEKKYIITQCIKYKNHDNDKPIVIVHCTEPDTHLNEERVPNISETNTTEAIPISENTLLAIADKALPTGYPKHVYNFLSDEHTILQEGVNYFLDPTDILQDQINAITSTNNYVALITVLIFKELDQDTINTLSDCFDVKNQRLKSSCHIIRDVFNKQKRNGSLRECVHNGVQAYLGTYICEKQTNTFTFSAKAVETAVILSLPKELKPYKLKELDNRLFNKFVSTDLAPENFKKSKSQICVNPDEKKTLKYVLKRLERTAMNGDLQSLVANPLMQDKLFAQTFFDLIKKKRKRTRKLFFMKDLTTQQTLIWHGLKCLFFNISPKDYRCNIAVMILFSRKWLNIRKEQNNFDWTREQERLVIDHCFQKKIFGSFVALIDKLNTNIELNYIIECVTSGMHNVLEKLLHLDAMRKMLSLEDLNIALIEALVLVCKDSTKNRLLIVEEIVNHRTLDFKINRHVAIPIAAKYGNEHLLLEALQKTNVDINAVDKYNRTCIHWAAINDHIEFVEKALCDPSADQLLYDSCGYMAIHHATENDSHEIVQTLYNHDNTIITKPEREMGMQPLHIAAINNYTKMAKFLIDHNVDINAKDKISKTPLHYAALSGKCEIMRLLLDANADLSVRDNEGLIPLELCDQKQDKIMITKYADNLRMKQMKPDLQPKTFLKEIDQNQF